MTDLFRNHLDVIYFVYGLAFFSMGLAIFVQSIGKSKFRLANVLWLLAWFGVLHGINEWLDQWALIKGVAAVMGRVRLAVLAVSYFFLFEFGRRLFRLQMQKYPPALKAVAGRMNGALTGAVVACVLLLSGLSHEFSGAGAMWVRHLLGFPGAVMTALGFLLYHRYEKEDLGPLRVKGYVLAASLSFFMYGILAGLVVPKGPWLSSWVNAESFLAVVHVPVQLIRSLCAVAAGICVIGLLKIFHWETAKGLLDEVANRKLNEEALRDSADRYRSFIEVTGQLAWTTGPDGAVTDDLPTWRRFTGQSAGEVMGWGWSGAVHPEDAERVRTVWKKALEEKSTYEVEYRIRRADGIYRYFMARGIPILRGDGSVREWVGTCIDITERKEMETQLRDANEAYQRLAVIDHLTGLYNRRGLENFLAHMMPRVMRFLADSHAVLIDLDNFKTVNDTFGYVIGDAVLREVAQKIKGAVRATDYVARVGGDEFMLLLPGTRRSEASAVAEKIRLEISKAVVGISGNRTVRVSASIGVVSLTEGEATIDELLERTRHALAESKRAGKNAVSYDDGTGAFEVRADPAAEALNRLCSGGHLDIVLQPIVDLRDSMPVAYEMLSRFQHPGFETPDLFFRMAMEAKVLTLVDHSCLKKCLLRLEGLPRGVRFHINLFPSSIINLTAEKLVEELASAGKGHDICVEISEQQFIGDATGLIETVRALKKAGIAVAIDDAGFGGGCLESIILLEPDIVKIDKSCIRGIHRDSPKIQSLRRMLRVIASCHAESIVEGIETAEELEVLRDMGVRYGQGYFFGKPAQDVLFTAVV